MRRGIDVAVIEPVGGHGGMDYYDLGLCRGLLAAGCRVSLYTCDETAVPSTPGLRFYPVYKHIYGHGRYWARGCRYLAGTLAALARTVISGQHVCHFHFFHGVIPELALVLLAKLCRRRVIITVHDVESLGNPPRVSRSTIGKVYDLADYLIVHNEVSRRELIERLGVCAAKISVIPHGHYLEAVRRMPDNAEAKRALGIPESKKVVLFFGHIKDVKGLDLLLEAVPEVALEIPEVAFLIAGRPWKSDFSRYETLIRELGIADRCVLHIRFIRDDEVPSYYAAADVVVLPYRRTYQSGVVLMAMSYRRPVVVSDLPGMTEIVTDEQNGYVFQKGSKNALSKRLIQALQNEHERDQVAGRALEYIQKNHNWEHIGKQTTELYHALVP